VVDDANRLTVAINCALLYALGSIAGFRVWN